MKPETREWIKVADRDFGSARSLLQDGFAENAAYFCQQAAEKLLKAALTEGGREPPKTHDLVEWADLAEIQLTGERQVFLTRLSDHAARSRYPGAEYTEEEVRELLEETKRFLEWLRARLS